MPGQNQAALPLLNPFLGWLPAAYWRRVKSEYSYELNLLTVSGGTVTGQLTFDADADFLLLKQTRTIFLADLVTVVPTAHHTVQIVDSSSGRNRTNQPIHVENYFGTAANIANAPTMFPKLIPAATVWTFTVADLATVACQIRFAFHGFKIYPMVEQKQWKRHSQ